MNIINNLQKKYCMNRKKGRNWRYYYIYKELVLVETSCKLDTK